MWIGNRREALQWGAAVAGTGWATLAAAQDRAPRGPQAQQDKTITVLNPRDRVPLSFIIDDSTCLVNMGHFCMPQFAECYPNRESYKKPWKSWPREIPDAFVREFGEWCRDHGVKGKYSIVPYPACVGWLDRELPGWSRRDLQSSLKLVRELMVPDWDIHPEMITHTRVIDLKTGRPFAEISPATMENSYPQEKKSADEMADYLAYALKVLHNCELPCQGITTPGGFGNRVKSELSQAVHEAVDDVFKAEIPHYFKYVVTGEGSTEPVLEHVRDLSSSSPKVTVNIPAATGDWFGGWDGVRKPEGPRYATDDGRAGRLVELIKKGQPALMLCHWPGMYNNGARTGFRQFQKVVVSLAKHYGDQTLWMKLSEMARYWAAKGLTSISRAAARISVKAPFACPFFTIAIKEAAGVPTLNHGGKQQLLAEVKERRQLRANTWLRIGRDVVVCADLQKGGSLIEFM